jgi:hypothetical protein
MLRILLGIRAIAWSLRGIADKYIKLRRKIERRN